MDYYIIACSGDSGDAKLVAVTTTRALSLPLCHCRAWMLSNAANGKGQYRSVPVAACCNGCFGAGLRVSGLTGLLLALYHEVDGLLVAQYHAVVVRQCYGNALRSGWVRRRCRNVLRLAGRLLPALVAVAKD
jgi:hypothetical protein